MATLPKCQFCDLPARYDAPTVLGPWAYLCTPHWHTYRRFKKLGTGLGQKLVLASSAAETTEPSTD